MKNNMKLQTLVLQSILLLFAADFCFAQTFLNGLPNTKVKQILTDQRDRFFVDSGSDIDVISDIIDYRVRIAAPDKNDTNSDFKSTVSSQGVIYSVFKSSYTPKNSKTTHYRLYLAKCPKKHCNYTHLESWSYTSGSKNTTSYSASLPLISIEDGLFFTLTHSDSSGSELYYYFNGQKISRSVYRSKYSDHFPKQKVSIAESKAENKSWFGVLADTQDVRFKVDGHIKTHPNKRSSRYQRTIVRDKEGMPHLFFHDPGDRSFYHQFYSEEKKAILEQAVDHAESGHHNVAFLGNSEIWSIHYYHRSAFNQGVLVTRHDLKDGKIVGQFLIDGSKKKNSGWGLMGAQSSEKRILFSYLPNASEPLREYILLEKVEDLLILKNNFSAYGHPKGKFMPVPKEERLTSGRVNESKRPGYLHLGVGIQHITWSVTSGTPDDTSGVSTPFDVEYELSDSFLNIMSLEGKYGSTNFALDYATKILDKEVEQEGTDTAKKINTVAGAIGWDKLLFDFDLKVSFENTESRVFFKDKSGQVPSRNFEMNFKEIKLSLLNLNRQHFGLLYQTYNFFQPVFIYKAPAGSTAYQFDSQAIGDIDVQNYFLHYGYSELDYIVKHQSEANTWFLDGEIRGGLTFADFNGDLQVSGNKKPGNEFTFGYGAQVELGYILFKRWERFFQFGAAIKLSYRFEYLKVGSSDKPDNRDNASDSEDFAFNFERTEMRYGPLLFISFVW